MILPDISTWNAGTQHDQVTFNAVSYALNFLLNPPECEVTQTAAQSVASTDLSLAGGAGGVTPITFNGATTDNDGMWNPVAPLYVTAQTPGWYEIEYAVSWATVADASLRTQALYLNLNLSRAKARGFGDYTNASGATPQVVQSYDLFLNSGDRVSLGVMQNSGASLSTASSATLKDQRTFLRLRWASL